MKTLQKCYFERYNLDVVQQPVFGAIVHGGAFPLPLFPPLVIRIDSHNLEHMKRRQDESALSPSGNDVLVVEAETGFVRVTNEDTLASHITSVQYFWRRFIERAFLTYLLKSPIKTHSPKATYRGLSHSLEFVQQPSHGLLLDPPLACSLCFPLFPHLIIRLNVHHDRCIDNELPNMFCEINILRVKSGIVLEDVTKSVFPAPTPEDPHPRSHITEATLFNNMAQKTDISTSMYFVYPLIVIPDNGAFRIDATVRDRRMQGIPPLPNSKVVPDVIGVLSSETISVQRRKLSRGYNGTNLHHDLWVQYIHEKRGEICSQGRSVWPSMFTITKEEIVNGMSSIVNM
ncbi:hypothetical protein BJ138DRAFT_1102605 [Hygrophoropsis aurantiaca]|uniref:Uncharacterized protein n=1 Tax=Hygrophoropsis aurantiaca TaxID=72124 RepID=A0ACB8A905_9AGAM|nr:hypothetical protein BJ138DRAFT_1102605 [Hygrophoropsis aurantiaca]